MFAAIIIFFNYLFIVVLSAHIDSESVEFMQGNTLSFRYLQTN